MKFKTRLKASPIFVDLTPLVDVIFLLLVFFLVTSDILPLKSLNIETPALEAHSTPLTSRLLVVMDAQNVIYVGNRRDIVDLASFKTHLEKELQQLKIAFGGAEPSIVLSIDRRVAYGPFLRLFALTQECGHKIRLVYHDNEEPKF